MSRIRSSRGSKPFCRSWPKGTPTTSSCALRTGANWLVAGLGGLALGLHGRPALAKDRAGEETRTHFRLERQPLSEALIAFAVQANVSIATPPDGLGDVRSGAVSGALDPQTALRRLLAGTHFVFVRVDAVTYRIERAAARPTQPKRAHVIAPQDDMVVVTARRRPESLDRVPAAGSVVGSAGLADLGVRNATDLSAAVAGLGYTNLGPGRDKIFIRSLSDGAFTGRTASTVGMYFDDSRVTYGAPNPDLALIDVDRVEVLRGPQGALYGSGSIGGLVHVVTREPDLYALGGSVSGDVAFGRSADPDSGANIVMNVPIAEGRLGVRGVAFERTEGGWLDHAALNLRKTNRVVTQGARLTAKADLDDTWTVTARGLYQDIRARDSQYVDRAAGKGKRATRLLEPYTVDFNLGGLTVEGPTHWGKLTSTTSYVRHSLTDRYDASGSFGNLGVRAADAALFDTTEELNFLIEEAHLSSAASPFPWSVGVFASFGAIESEERLTLVRPTLPSRDTGALYTASRKDLLTELAIYGDVALPIAPGWTIDLGARAFRSTTDARGDAKSRKGALDDQFSGDRTGLGVSPSLQLSYEPNERAYYYLKFNEGYRTGGFNIGAKAKLEADGPASSQPVRRFGPDRLLSAELGAKWTFFNGAARLRAAAYWQGWENIQTDQLIVSGLHFTGNVGNAVNHGVEVEGNAILSPHLSAMGHISYALPYIKSPDPTFPRTTDVGLPGAPKMTAGAGLIASQNFGRLGEGKLVVNGIYVGHSDVTFAKTKATRIGGYFVGDIRMELDRDKWSWTTYVQNLADNRAETFSYGNPFRFGDPGLVTPLRPRVFGVSLTRAF